MGRFLADLHIHSCLSPCAEIDLTPRAIVKKALEQGIDIIAITDHNSMKNIPAALSCANGTSLTVLTGMEITTSEEIHVLALFDSRDFNMGFSDIIYSNLEDVKNDVEHFGYQIVVNAVDEILEFEQRLLIGSTRLNLDQVLELIHINNGIAIPCHIDKQSFSIISQLGFIPEGLPVEAIEVSKNVQAKDMERFSNKYGIPVVSFSDTHFLSDFGSRLTEFEINAPTFDEIKRVFTDRLVQQRII
jgi:hypothetical protein